MHQAMPSTKSPNKHEIKIVHERNRQCAFSLVIRAWSFGICLVLGACDLVLCVAGVSSGAAPAPRWPRGAAICCWRTFGPSRCCTWPSTQLTRAKFPVVDVHTHFRHKFRGTAEELDAWVQADGPQQHRRLRQPRRPVGRAGRRARQAALDEAPRPVRRSSPISTGKVRGKADDPATWDCHRPDFARRVARQLAAAEGARRLRRENLQAVRPGIQKCRRLADQDRRSAVGSASGRRAANWACRC